MIHSQLLTCYQHCQQISNCLQSRLGVSASFCLSFYLIVCLVLLGMVLSKFIPLQKYSMSYSCWSNQDNCSSTSPIVLPMVAMMMLIWHMGKWSNLQGINLLLCRHVILVCLRSQCTLLIVVSVQYSLSIRFLWLMSQQLHPRDVCTLLMVWSLLNSRSRSRNSWAQTVLSHLMVHTVPLSFLPRKRVGGFLCALTKECSISKRRVMCSHSHALMSFCRG